MTALFSNLKARPLLIRCVAMVMYGVISFVLIYWLGSQMLGNPLLALLLEGIWFVHILYVVNQISVGSPDFFTLAICGLSPGLIKNLLAAFSV